jgi:hypothetical protein
MTATPAPEPRRFRPDKQRPLDAAERRAVARMRAEREAAAACTTRGCDAEAVAILCGKALCAWCYEASWQDGGE